MMRSSTHSFAYIPIDCSRNVVENYENSFCEALYCEEIKMKS